MSKLTHFEISELPGVVFYRTLDLKPVSLGKQKGETENVEKKNIGSTVRRE